MVSRTGVGITLVAAAVIGFLGGALAARVSAETGPVLLPAPTVTVGVTPQPRPETPVPVATLTLVADRGAAEPRELIRLSGQLTPSLGGVPLQVQQSVDSAGFSDFPVTDTTEQDGSFGTWVRTQRTGRSEFRVVTEVNGQRVVSPPVAVQIGPGG